MRLDRATLLNLPLVLFLGWAGAAAAQEPQEPKDPKAPDQAAPPDKADKPVTLLEEITVTAQKREESLQDVPVTMQAFTGRQLERFQVQTLTGVVKLAPNLNVVVQNALSQHIMIRGVGTNEFFGNAPSSVGTYMDDVTMNSSYTSTLGLFDMERVEVLRGPAEHAVRPQHHRRRRQLHHQAARPRRRSRRLCLRDLWQPQPGRPGGRLDAPPRLDSRRTARGQVPQPGRPLERLHPGRQQLRRPAALLAFAGA